MHMRLSQVLHPARGADVTGQRLQTHRVAGRRGQPECPRLLLDVHSALGRDREHARQPGRAIAQHTLLAQIHAQSADATADVATACAQKPLRFQADVATGLQMRPGAGTRHLHRTPCGQPKSTCCLQTAKVEAAGRALADAQIAFVAQHNVTIAVSHDYAGGIHIEIVNNAQGHAQQVTPILNPLTLDHVAHAVNRGQQHQVLRTHIDQLNRSPKQRVSKVTTRSKIDRGVVAQVDVTLVVQ